MVWRGFLWGGVLLGVTWLLVVCGAEGGFVDSWVGRAVSTTGSWSGAEANTTRHLLVLCSAAR
jgi:hypothetical protein